MDKYSLFSNGDINAFEELYNNYKIDANSVDIQWKYFFEGFEFQKSDYTQNEISGELHKEFKVLKLIEDYRERGHLFTKTNPVRERREYYPKLDIENYGLSQSDLDIEFSAALEVGLEKKSTLSKIIQNLEEIYCHSIGIEYMHIRDGETIKWLRNKLEIAKNEVFTKEIRQSIYSNLSKASSFESFLQKKFVGQKRFSLEGSENFIPAMHELINEGAELGIKEFVIGMAHRGRLNVLANIFQKPIKEIFSEFRGTEFESEIFSGDVKYHLGWSNKTKTNKGKEVVLTLSPNPSHLEAVNPVVEGITRAKIDNYLKNNKEILPILIHGDAAIAGQGIVYEVVQMLALEGYQTGGTIHFVINNQVGFTTNFIDARSSIYCTDIGKITLSPIFHVNGDDTEAILKTTKIALEFRQKFGRDVFIDLLSYRKYGHNEGDEPKFTQPKLYDLIQKHPNPSKIYSDFLIDNNILSSQEIKNIDNEIESILEYNFELSKEIKISKVTHFLPNIWKDINKDESADLFPKIPTKIPILELKSISKKINTLPIDKKIFRKVISLYQDRLSQLENGTIDWGTAENIAYATLLNEGYSVRISGQDVERGTFSHRHSVLKTTDDEEEIIPLKLCENESNFYIYNSHLSEYGVMGFEFGYSVASPDTLTIWEAQFGDFSNGAQIIFDQFLSAAEDKWNVLSGLVILLPHGYEGMGSEHSSGRLERFLQLCAKNNMQIVNCTTPDNFYHLLRKQMHTKHKKPLVVFTPKKLLRYPKAVCNLEQLAEGEFQYVINDNTDFDKINNIVFCSGKIYYDLLEARENNIINQDTAFIRIEQLYPFPEKEIKNILSKYKNDAYYSWVQEEPENMGALSFIMLKFIKMGKIINCISREESGSPATGSAIIHNKQQNEIINKVAKLSTVKMTNKISI